MSDGILQHLNGIKIIINDQRQGKLEIRSWKERLFYRPWNPLKKYNEVDAGPVIDDGKIIQTPGAWTMNSKTWREIDLAIKNQNKH